MRLHWDQFGRLRCACGVLGGVLRIAVCVTVPRSDAQRYIYTRLVAHATLTLILSNPHTLADRNGQRIDIELQCEDSEDDQRSRGSYEG